MSTHLWWNLTRASANVAWILMFVSILWGVLMATRVLRPAPRPAWMLDLHRWLGWLTVIFTGLHMTSLVADSYVTFTVVDLLVPFSGSWKPGAVALGIISAYVLAAVQLTSVAMKRISKTTWRRIHMSSYVMFAVVSLHALLAGSDSGSRWFASFSMALVMMTAAAGSLRLVVGRKATQTRNN